MLQSDLDGTAAVVISLAINDIAAAAASRNLEAEGFAVGCDVVGVLSTVNQDRHMCLGIAGTHLVAARRGAVPSAVGVHTANADNGVTALELGNGVCGRRGNGEAGHGGKEA